MDAQKLFKLQEQYIAESRARIIKNDEVINDLVSNNKDIDVDSLYQISKSFKTKVMYIKIGKMICKSAIVNVFDTFKLKELKYISTFVNPENIKTEITSDEQLCLLESFKSKKHSSDNIYIVICKGMLFDMLNIDADAIMNMLPTSIKTGIKRKRSDDDDVISEKKLHIEDTPYEYQHTFTNFEIENNTEENKINNNEMEINNNETNNNESIITVIENYNNESNDTNITDENNTININNENTIINEDNINNEIDNINDENNIINEDNDENTITTEDENSIINEDINDTNTIINEDNDNNIITENNITDDNYDESNESNNNAESKEIDELSFESVDNVDLILNQINNVNVNPNLKSESKSIKNDQQITDFNEILKFNIKTNIIM